MQKPILTWYVKLPSETEYTAANEKYLGAVSSRRKINVSLRLWNNRYGKDDTEDLKSFAVRLSFYSLEDSALFKFCSLKMNDISLEGQIVGGRMIFAMPSGTQLSGKANNGLTADNPSNYKDYILTFAVPEEVQLKENDLKNLFVEIISM